MSFNDITSFVGVLILVGLIFYAIFRINKQDCQPHNK